MNSRKLGGMGGTSRKEKYIGVSWGVLSIIRIIWLTMEQWNVAKIARCASYKRAIEDNNEGHGNRILGEGRKRCWCRCMILDLKEEDEARCILWWKYTLARYKCPKVG